MELDKKLGLSVQKTRSMLQIFSGFIAFSGLVNFILLLLVPADQKNALMLGFSSKRLAILIFLLIGITAFFIATIKLSKTSPKTILWISNAFRKQSISAILILFFFLVLLLVWVAGFSPEYLLIDYFAIARRLLPLLIWFLSISVSMLGFCFFLNAGESKSTIINNQKYWRLLAVTTTALVIFFLSIAWVYPKLTYQLWFGRYSVPFLATQIFAAFVLVSLGLLIPGAFWKKIPALLTNHIDLILFVSIWLISAVLWVNQPIEFMGDMSSTTIEQHIKPLPPNFEIYPRKDSATYFNISESIVTGGGIYRSIDKSLFLAFEGLNNWLAGGSFERMLNYQTILLASFPAVIYLLGRKLHSIPTGLLAASLAVMQEINGIRLMDEFPVVSSKVLLSEPFMQLWTAIIALFAFIAFKRSGKSQTKFFIILGGSLGLSALFRLNTIVIIPFIILVALIHYFQDRKIMIRSIGILFIGIFLAFSPWMTHNAIKYGDPLAFIKSKVSGVIIDRRYENIDNNSRIGNSINPVEILGLSNGLDDKVSENNSWKIKPPEVKASLKMDFAGLINVRLPNYINSKILNIPQIFVSILRHTLNNTITSFSILPTSINPQDLFHGSRNQRFWGGYDVASYEGINPIIVALNLLILAIGISSAINKHRVVGLVPIAIFFGYHLSNGLAISSGNRYAQPVTWVIFFYYAIGLISISKSLLNLLRYENQLIEKEPDKTVPTNKWIGMAFVILCVLLLGSTPVIADLIPANRFPITAEQQLISALNIKENLKLGENSYSFGELLSSSKPNGLSVSYGRILTPVLVNNEEFQQAYGKTDYKGIDRYLTFMMLGTDSGNIKRKFFYPQSQIFGVLNGSDAVIFFQVGNENEVLGIGIIDPVFSSRITSYKDISQIQISKFYFSKHLPK
jgi:hypothetical protein